MATHPDPQTPRGESLDDSTQKIMDQNLWWKILLGMVLGFGVGLILSPQTGWVSEQNAFAAAEWIALPGTLFLALIQMVIIPLVMSSIILGIAESRDLAFLKKMSLRLIPYFILTTSVAITIGIVLVNWINPGQTVNQDIVQTVLAQDSNLPERTFEDLSIPERIQNILPTNPAKAQVDQNLLQIVVFAILLGVALVTIPAATGKVFRDLCIALQTLSMKIISWAMAIAPYAVFGLLCSITIKIGFDAFISVGLYSVTVILGLLSMGAVYLLIVFLFGRRSPLAFLSGIREAQLLAFSTSSSAATMPFSIQCAEEKLKIRPEVCRFVIPLGATINMDGTALYQAVAAIFLCQVFGIDLTMGQTILLLVTTVGASIGTPATPGVGLIVLITILTGIGVPAEGIALIIGVDRLLDMCRTTINVTGDLTAATVMDRWLPQRKQDEMVP